MDDCDWRTDGAIASHMWITATVTVAGLLLLLLFCFLKFQCFKVARFRAAALRFVAFAHFSQELPCLPSRT